MPEVLKQQERGSMRFEGHFQKQGLMGLYRNASISITKMPAAHAWMPLPLDCILPSAWEKAAQKYESDNLKIAFGSCAVKRRFNYDEVVRGCPPYPFELRNLIERRFIWNGEKHRISPTRGDEPLYPPQLSQTQRCINYFCTYIMAPGPHHSLNATNNDFQVMLLDAS